MSSIMKGFPPTAADQSELANWRTTPFNRWAFHHVREIVPSANIAHDPENIWSLEPAPADLSQISVTGSTGTTLTLDDYFHSADTDGFIVLQNGRVVFENYPHTMAPGTPHILMSVSKSVLGLVTGIAITQGALREDDLIEKFVPEISRTAYAGNTIRDLLDMRVGVVFDEDYLATSGPIIEYRKATNWNPLQPGDKPSDLRSFFTSLTHREDSYDERFHYVSPNTDLLGWVVERATDQRFADYTTENLWKPLGAESSAYVTVDRFGAPRVAGGICVDVRDLARLGLLVANCGARGDHQIIAESWIADIIANGDHEAWNKGDFVDFFPGMQMHYRSKWYVLRGENPIVFGLGIHGQNVFIDTNSNIVIAQVSSQPEPLNPDKELDAMRVAAAIMDALR